MKCSKCNFENPDDAARCKECGAVLGEGAETMVLEAQTQVNVDPLSFSPGEIFGQRYQIIEEIGEGGMGRVFKAMDLELNIVVALKMIKPQLSADPDIVARFKRELLLAREILHEHVIRIHDLGEINGIKYISMNYIQGNSLQETIQATGKLTVEKSIDITRQICSALIAAHSKGIIHRDLKPQNIMIDKKGNAYVLDFGIARSIKGDAGSTQEGILMGTPYFMSPEQIKGEKADASTDIYSLGIIMYEIVTGKLPFTADNPNELLRKHLMEKPELPSKLNPQIPVKLEKIILRCLEKKKKDRYHSVEQIIKDLEHDKTIEIKPVKEKKIKENRAGGYLLKHGMRLFILLLAIYAVISALSYVNDSIYSAKIESLKGESETYYKNHFPLKKDWLPADWQPKDCNGWDTYIELFPPKSDKEGNDLPQRQYLQNDYAKNILVNALVKKFDAIANGFDYKDTEELKSIIANYGTYFQYDRLFDAITCSVLDPSAAIKNSRILYLPMILKYADMITLQARVDLLEGDYEAGLTKLYRFMIFTMDLFAASTNLMENQVALSCFIKICRELIPLLLCRDITFNSLSPLQTECLAAFGDYKDELFPFSLDSPPPEETFDLPMIDSFERLINVALQKFEPHSIFNREYLALAKNYDNIYDTMGMKTSDYHIYGKLKFWRHWFSINRYFYKEGIEFYRGLFEGMKYIRDMRNKSIFINNYFKENLSSDNAIIANVSQSAFALNVSRTFGKLVLIIHTINKYGFDSKEFLSLKGTDLFINELSGDKFEMTGEEYDYSIILDKNFKLNLKKLNYRESHKEMLKSFKYFDLDSEDIRSLFYSFKLE